MNTWVTLNNFNIEYGHKDRRLFMTASICLRSALLNQAKNYCCIYFCYNWFT